MEIKRLNAEDYVSLDRKLKKNELQMIEVILKMKDLEFHPKDWVWLSFNNIYKNPNCFYRFAWEYNGEPLFPGNDVNI